MRSSGYVNALIKTKQAASLKTFEHRQVVPSFVPPRGSPKFAVGRNHAILRLSAHQCVCVEAFLPKAFTGHLTIYYRPFQSGIVLCMIFHHSSNNALVSLKLSSVTLS